MGLCHLQESPHLDDLRAANLETLIQLVSAGFGCTLVPALSLRSSWASGSGVVLREIKMGDAEQRVRLVTRKTFPHTGSVDALANLIREELPNTVMPIERRDMP